MGWFGAEQQARREDPVPPTSLEYQTTINARGVSPAAAVIEQLTAAECRLRTVMFFDKGETIEFEFGAQGMEHVRAHGYVVDRVSKGPRFAYRLRLDRMATKETDALARAVAENYRRQARARAQRRALETLPTTEALTRAHMRVLAHFPIAYRKMRDGSGKGKAFDVSAGGLSMMCDEILAKGEELEIRFTLPSSVLDVHPEQTAILDLRTRAVRHERSDLRRPFEEMVARVHVVSHHPAGNGHHKYGLSFVGTSDFRREELARYVHASQLAKRRIGR